MKRFFVVAAALACAAAGLGFRKSPGQEEPGDLKIAAVDVTGAAASVKVVEVYPTETYTDYLNLLRIGGEWKIVNKIYVVEKR